MRLFYWRNEMALGYAAALRNSRLQAIVDLAGANAKVRLYSGSRPATGGTATTQLAELTCGATLGTISTGVLTFNAITQDTSADANGTASWFRVVKSDGSTHVLDGNCGTSGSDMNMVTTTITAGQPVSISSWTITESNP